MEAKAETRKRPTELSFENIDNGVLRLRTKPTSRLAYSFIPAHDHPKSIARPGTPGGEPLLIFLSGLDNSRNVWQKTLDRLFESACAIGAELPPMLFYDRFGVGGSDPEPTDAGKKPEEFHDCIDAVKDLHQVVVQLMELKFGWSRHVDQTLEQDLPRMVFCAHSFGVCVARMFADAYPGVVQGILMLESAITAFRAEDVVPNPADPMQWASRHDPKTAWGRSGFPDEDILPRDVISDIRQKLTASVTSRYATKTKAKICWDHMSEHLPLADAPKLRGPTEHLPRIIVLTSDPEVLASQNERIMKMDPKIIRNTFAAVGAEYHAGLPHLQPKGKGKGPIVVQQAGHMIHLDAPETVARELLELVELSSRAVRQDEKDRAVGLKSRI